MNQERFGEIMQTIVLLEAANYDLGASEAEREGLNIKAKIDRLRGFRDDLRKELVNLLRMP